MRNETIERRHSDDDNYLNCANPHCRKPIEEELVGKYKYCRDCKNEHQRKYLDSRVVVKINFLERIKHLLNNEDKLYIEQVFKRHKKK